MSWGRPEDHDGGIAAARKAFGTIQVIGRQFVPVPGSTQTVEYRALKPDGQYSGPMVGLVQGHYPSGAGQVAVTSGLAQPLQVHIGSVLSLPGHHQRVTGIVENPSDLKDQFALLPPSAAGTAQEVTVLLDASPSTFSEFRDTFHGQLVWQARGANTQGAVAAGAPGAVTVLTVLVSLVASAAFTVLAARRQRQLGMLAAVGATQKQLRMVMIASGALVGTAAAVTGVVIGLAGWFVAAPHLESFADHRIGRFAAPWELVVLGMLLAVLTATGAAWWPARATSRVPVINALSARPLKPRPAHRTAISGVLLIASALACLAVANQTSAPLIIFGALAMTLGISFISRLSIRVLTLAGRRAPVAVRLALRDLARYQARSAAALAAISLGLGIAVAIIISSAAAVYAATAGNLPADQMLIWIGQPGDNQLVPIRTPAELSTLAAAAHRIAASLDGATVIPLYMPVSPASKPQPGGQQPVVSLNAPVGRAAGRNGVYRATALYVGTRPSSTSSASTRRRSIRPPTSSRPRPGRTSLPPPPPSRTPQTSSESTFLTTAPNPHR